MQIVLKTLWEDHSTINLSLLQENTKAELREINPRFFRLSDSETREIEISCPEELRQDFPYTKADLLSLESGIPEYSGLDLEFHGSLIQKTTEIDAKIKGDVSLVNDSKNRADFIELLRVKSEHCTIKVENANIFVRRYMEAKNLTIRKKAEGDVKIKRLGISHKMDSEFSGTKIDIEAMWVHREPGNACKFL
jgi:hypothetical protein